MLLPSLQLAVGQFMTECFINHKLYSVRLHVGPSFEDHARVDFRQSIQQIWSDSNCVHQQISNIGLSFPLCDMPIPLQPNISWSLSPNISHTYDITTYVTWIGTQKYQKYFFIVSSLRQHGLHQANCLQIYWMQSSPKTAWDQGGS